METRDLEYSMLLDQNAANSFAKKERHLPSSQHMLEGHDWKSFHRKTAQTTNKQNSIIDQLGIKLH